jgi:large subunit ribosomal protein L34e
MPRRSLRSSGYKRKAKKTQSGIAIHRQRKRAGKMKCACGRPLNSAPRTTSSKASKKTNRPFGGSLCPVCTKKKLLDLARIESRNEAS